jgi:hypothetical protein
MRARCAALDGAAARAGGRCVRIDVGHVYAPVVEVLKFLYSAHFDPLAAMRRIAHGPLCHCPPCVATLATPPPPDGRRSRAAAADGDDDDDTPPIVCEDLADLVLDMKARARPSPPRG